MYAADASVVGDVHAVEPMTEPQDQTGERLAVLLRRLSDARSILGCGDDPDRTPAIEEIERLECELQQLEEARPLCSRVPPASEGSRPDLIQLAAAAWPAATLSC